MSALYYLIPTTEPPYNRQNPQRPKYLREYRYNWTGYPLQRFGYYVCKVNTTSENHRNLQACEGVILLPDWNASMVESLNAINLLKMWLDDRLIPFDLDETTGELMNRLIQTDIFQLEGISLKARFRDLLKSRKEKVIKYCDIFGEAHPSFDETIGQLTRRLGGNFWRGNELFIEEH